MPLDETIVLSMCAVSLAFVIAMFNKITAPGLLSRAWPSASPSC